MKPRLAASIAALALLAAGCGGTGGEQAAPWTSGTPASAIRVGLQEWAVTAPAASARPGQVTFTVTNTGSDPHDLQVSQGGEQVGKTPLLDPGQRADLRVQVQAGSPLRLICTVPGHEEAGMVTKMSVAKPD